MLQITTVDEAKQFYPLFGLGANIALVFSGRTVKYFSNLRKTLGPGVDGWAISLKGMMSIVVLLGFVICGIYWGVNRFILNDPSLPKSTRKKKVRLVEGCFKFITFGVCLYLRKRNPFAGETQTRYDGKHEVFTLFKICKGSSYFSCCLWYQH